MECTWDAAPRRRGPGKKSRAQSSGTPEASTSRGIPIESLPYIPSDPPPRVPRRRPPPARLPPIEALGLPGLKREGEEESSISLNYPGMVEGQRPGEGDPRWLTPRELQTAAAVASRDDPYRETPRLRGRPPGRGTTQSRGQQRGSARYQRRPPKREPSSEEDNDNDRMDTD
jgi:hypothetical protein